MDELNFSFLKEININQAEFKDYDAKIASISRAAQNEKIDFSKFDVAIVGINNTTDVVRKELYDLYKPHNINIIDIGDIILYENEEQNIENLQNLVAFLTSKELKIIFIGQKEYLNIAFYKFYENKKNIFEAINIDARIDLDFSENTNSDNFLNYLKNNNQIYSNYYLLGYQKYLVNQQLATITEKLRIKTFRLGQVTNEMTEFEPFFRNSQIVSVDLSAIRAADVLVSEKSSPNGFSADDACRLAYFAGLGEKINIFAVFEVGNNLSNNCLSEKLTAQIIWHFLDAYALKKMIKQKSNNKFLTYYLNLKHEKEIKLKFKKCVNTNRWWFVVTNKSETLIPCTQKDYEHAKLNILTQRVKEQI